MPEATWSWEMWRWDTRQLSSTLSPAFTGTPDSWQLSFIRSGFQCFWWTCNIMVFSYMYVVVWSYLPLHLSLPLLPGPTPFFLTQSPIPLRYYPSIVVSYTAYLSVFSLLPSLALPPLAFKSLPPHCLLSSLMSYICIYMGLSCT